MLRSAACNYQVLGHRPHVRNLYILQYRNSLRTLKCLFTTVTIHHFLISELWHFPSTFFWWQISCKSQPRKSKLFWRSAGIRHFLVQFFLLSPMTPSTVSCSDVAVGKKNHSRHRWTCYPTHPEVSNSSGGCRSAREIWSCCPLER